MRPNILGAFGLHFGAQNAAERLEKSKQKFGQLLKVTFEAPGTILVPFWSPKWSQNARKVVTKRTSCRKSAFSLNSSKTHDFSMKIGGRGLRFGGPSGHKAIKKRSWNSGSVLDRLFTDFGRIWVSFWEAKTAPKRPQTGKNDDILGTCFWTL